MDSCIVFRGALSMHRLKGSNSFWQQVSFGRQSVTDTVFQETCLFGRPKAGKKELNFRIAQNFSLKSVLSPVHYMLYSEVIE